MNIDQKKEKPLVSIIIVSFNNCEILLKTIRSLINNINSTHFEIIVVDNNSKENNVQEIEKNFPYINLIKNHKNLGFGRACNLGAGVAMGEYCLFCNSDIILLEDPLPNMLKIFNNCADAGLVGIQLLNSDLTYQTSYYSKPTLTKKFLELIGIKKILLKFIRTKSPTKSIFKVDIVKGAFFLINRHLFNEVGGFDLRFFMYVEDVDLSYKISKLGYNNYFLNEEKIIHLGWHSVSLENPLTYFYGNIGLIIFYLKHYSYFKSLLLTVLLLNFIAVYYLYYLLTLNQEKSRMLRKLIKFFYSCFKHLIKSRSKCKTLKFIDGNKLERL